MIVSVPCNRADAKRGVLLTSRELWLTGYGIDDVSAMRDLKEGIEAWCRAMSRNEPLRQALERHNIECEDDGNSETKVRVVLPVGERPAA